MKKKSFDPRRRLFMKGAAATTATGGISSSLVPVAPVLADRTADIAYHLASFFESEESGFGEVEGTFFFVFSEGELDVDNWNDLVKFSQGLQVADAEYVLQHLYALITIVSQDIPKELVLEDLSNTKALKIVSRNAYDGEDEIIKRAANAQNFFREVLCGKDSSSLKELQLSFSQKCIETVKALVEQCGQFLPAKAQDCHFYDTMKAVLVASEEQLSKNDVLFDDNISLKQHLQTAIDESRRLEDLQPVLPKIYLNLEDLAKKGREIKALYNLSPAKPDKKDIALEKSPIQNQDAYDAFDAKVRSALREWPKEQRTILLEQLDLAFQIAAETMSQPPLPSTDHVIEPAIEAPSEPRTQVALDSAPQLSQA